MHALLILAASAFLICLAITPLCRDLFVRAGLVDQPDSERRFHLRAVPRMGGIPIAVSYAAALCLVFYFNSGPNKLYMQHGPLFRSLLPAAAVIFVTGLLDDLFGLTPWQKLAGQFAGAALAVSLGAKLTLPHIHPVLTVLLSVLWLLCCTNAVNLIDGMDGLAAGVGLLAALSTLFVGLLGGSYGLALATAPLVGALLAFLRYNFSPASVFLGDCGSLTIGFLLGCFGLVWSQHTGTLLGMAAPLMAMALPLLDVGLAIGRRFLRAVPIFQADRAHIHHRVLALGFSTRGAALLLYAVCGVAASLAVVESLNRKGLGWPILVLFSCLVLAGIDRLGYVEFRAARKTFSHTFMLRAVQDHIILEELERALRGVKTVEDWWGIVRSACGSLDFASAELEFNGFSFREQFVASAGKATCRIYLGLGDDAVLILTRLPGKTSPSSMMSVLNQFQSSMEANWLLPPGSPSSQSHARIASTTAA
jgi:UDP-GlcNAc:undecaprenyl-phosphate GlcNAc-1-phosphate transferase